MGGYTELFTGSGYTELLGVLEILCQFFNLQHNVMRRIDYDQQIRF